jgi:potassium/hydrogen antiporter
VDPGQLDTVLLTGASVLLVAVLAVRLSVLAGLPSLLFYLAMGLGLGESGLGIRFNDASLAHSLGFAALILILAEGGLTTRWAEVRPAIPLGVALATVGIAVSVAVVAGSVHLVLGLGWRQAALLAAVTSATDAAAVFSLLRRVPITRSIQGALEAESGLNDAPAVLLVTLLSSGAGFEHGPLAAVGLVLYELTGGAVGGLLVGVAAAWLMRRVALPASGLYPITVLAFAVFSYAATAAVHASGFAAVYVTALVLGNAQLPHRAASRSFAEGIAWLAQIGLFVMLGLLASPAGLRWWHVGAALFTGAVLTLVARPLCVAACAAPFRMRWRHQAFLSWAGLRGAVPIVLATVPLAERLPGATNLFDVVFVMVVLFTLAQAPTLPWAARRLHVTDAGAARDMEVEAAPLERLGAYLLQVRIAPDSLMHGVEVGELRLPAGASVSLVVRAGAGFVPDRRTVLRRGDELLVVAATRTREQTERRLRAVSRGGRLAGWLGERQR